MFTAFDERLRRNQSGFTLIELLVVVLIIAILAAIAVPVFLNQRKRAWISQSQSALKNAATAEESYATANNGSYTTTLADLTAQGYNSVPNVTITFGTVSAGYCIIATHGLIPTGDAWKVSTFSSAAGAPAEADTC
ncbi:MAG: type IV pilin protein [Actinomycetota bacterium]